MQWSVSSRYDLKIWPSRASSKQVSDIPPRRFLTKSLQISATLRPLSKASLLNLKELQKPARRELAESFRFGQRREGPKSGAVDAARAASIPHAPIAPRC